MVQFERITVAKNKSGRGQRLRCCASKRGRALLAPFLTCSQLWEFKVNQYRKIQPYTRIAKFFALNSGFVRSPRKEDRRRRS